jgi:WD40 repeat protein/tRNA A-37 threonylcarbamoyl transferase component Bud32
LAAQQILGERYQVRSLLGRGGMGEVWRAYDLKLRVDVALKALRVELMADKRALETLRQEVRAAREVVSPNVCRVFDLVELDGRELVSMEYIDGTTLLEILRHRGPLELGEARELASQFLAGLEAIHDAGLIHRDVKPENLMITRAGRVVVMDFGIAKGLADRKKGTVAGTPAYMALEHTRGEAVDARADVFSAGVVMAEMIAPKGIRDNQARQALWRAVHHEPPELPESPWAAVLRKAVAREREERFVTASALARALEEVALRVEGAEDVEPYPGLASFTEEDAEYFFGRELEVEAMWKKLRRPHLLALIGPSGAGKSSFLRAGLVSTIPSGWHHVIATPANRPFMALASVLAEELADDSEEVQQLLHFEDPDVAVALVSRWRQQHKHALVIVDQFEELFTQNPPEVQERFAELLGRLALEADIHVLLSMRDDFLFYCYPHEALRPILSELTLLGAPTGAALRRAVVQPALKCGYRFEDEELVEEILTEVEGERGALPMLAFAAARLWDHRDRDQGLLTREAYEHIGGVGGALAQHAEATLERIGKDHIPIVRELFRNLVTAEGTRAARDREELLSVFDPARGHDPNSRGIRDRVPESAGRVPSPAADVLDTLIDARLLTSYELPAGEEEVTAHHRIEIIHESLLTNWPRLVRWQTQDTEGAQLRDELRQAAQMWDQHYRSTDLLWTGTAFQEFQLWRERYPGGLSATEEAFGEAMTRHAERRKRRRRIATTAAFVILLGVLAIIGGFWRRSVAETRRAEASKLLALGELEIDDDSTAAVAYALKSLELRDTPEARIFALKALWQGPTAFILPPVQPERGSEADTGGNKLFFRVAFSPDGKWFTAASGNDGQLWSEDGQTHGWSSGQGNESLWYGKVRFGQESDLLLSGGGKSIRFWSVPGARELRALEFDQFTWFQPVGAQLFTFTRVDEDRFWFQSRALQGGEPKTLGQFEGSAGVDPEGRWLAYVEGPALYAVPVEGLPGAQPRLVGRHDGPIEWFRFTPDGNRIASLGRTGDLRIWSLATGSKEPLRVLERTPARGWMAFDPGGNLLAAQSDLRTVHLWHLAGPPDAEPWALRRGRGQTSRTLESAFHPSGQWLATAHQQDAAFRPLSWRYSYVLPGEWEGDPPQLTFTSDGRSLATPSGGLRLWPLSSEAGEESQVLLERVWGDGIWPDIAEDRVGRRFLVPGSSGKLWLVPLDGREPRAMMTGFDSSLQTVAVDSQGGRAAVAVWSDSAEEQVIRVVDLESGAVQVLGPREDADRDYPLDLEFTPDGRLLSSGYYGLVRWNLEDGSYEVLGSKGQWMGSSSDGRFVATIKGPTIYDLEDGSSRTLTSHGQPESAVALDPTGRFIITADTSGVVRVGPVSGEEPHLLLGHEGAIWAVAVSPDGRWLATSSDDHTLRLWPMPDMDKPPFHTLPYDELLAKLRALTNLRVVEDEESATGYKLEPGPFPGWQEVPTW